MRIVVRVVLVSTLTSLWTAAPAEELPKTGMIKVHTGFKISADAVQVGEKRTQGHGSSVGVSFNDQGSGPLHEGPASCFWSFFVDDKSTKTKGYCTFGDANNDRIFLEFSGGNPGTGSRGGLELSGGTGKYAGVQGDGQWRCKGVGPNGQEVCTLQFNYRLP